MLRLYHNKMKHLRKTLDSDKKETDKFNKEFKKENNKLQKLIH